MVYGKILAARARQDYYLFALIDIAIVTVVQANVYEMMMNV